MSDSYLLTRSIFQEDVSITVMVEERGRHRCELEFDFSDCIIATYCHSRSSDAH